MRGSRRPDIGQGGILEQFDRYPMTLGILVANLLLYGFAVKSGGSLQIPGELLVRLGANHPELVKTQPWRLLTSAFLHAGPIHILFNSLALLYVGKILEVHFGSARLWVLYVVFAIGGGVGSNLWGALRGGGISVGASGAVLGLILLGWVWARSSPERLGGLARQLGTWIFYAALLSFLPRVDWAGHAGGALAGALCALVIHPEPGEETSPAWGGLAVVVALVCLGAFAITLRVGAA